MSTAIVAIIIISVLVFIVALLVVLNNRDRKKVTLELLERFSRLAMQHNLSFSSQEILENAIIGVDGIQRKVLFISRSGSEKYESILVDLHDVKSCSVRNVYRSVNVATGKEKKLEQLLDRIVIEFEKKYGGEPVQITFFQQMVNHFSLMKELEQKAKNWQSMLSKLISNDMVKIA